MTAHDIAQAAHLTALQDSHDQLLASHERLLKAADTVLVECPVAAPGPLWRWPDEYYNAFTGLHVAVQQARKVRTG